jgi:hypothetical protein
MEFKISFLSMITVLLISCSNKKAMEFRNAILQKQESASKILIGKEGLESRKLDYLIQQDFNRALSVIDTQEIAFNTLIREITDLDPAQLPTGPQLKQASIAYLEALKNLQLSDRLEIEQQMISRNATGDKQDAALDSLLDLSRKQQSLYQYLYKAEEQLVEATGKFNKANDL